MATIAGHEDFYDLSKSQRLSKPNRTVENHFKDLFCAHGESYDVSRVIDMLNLVHLTDGERILQSYPFQLSGGMQQRLAIALSLILKPKHRIFR